MYVCLCMSVLFFGCRYTELDGLNAEDAYSIYKDLPATSANMRLQIKLLCIISSNLIQLGSRSWANFKAILSALK